jgi:GT2 family glycosyltransferase
MNEGEGGIPHFLHPMEVSGGMQKVDITGGGCMLIRTEVFDRIAEPWFAPEHDFGTDIQLCRQVRAAGWEVWCDTSIEIGHLRSEREVLSSAKLKRAFKAVA